jgi:hypothetical protein
MTFFWKPMGYQLLGVFTPVEQKGRLYIALKIAFHTLLRCGFCPLGCGLRASHVMPCMPVAMTCIVRLVLVSRWYIMIGWGITCMLAVHCAWYPAVVRWSGLRMGSLCRTHVLGGSHNVECTSYIGEARNQWRRHSWYVAAKRRVKCLEIALVFLYLGRVPNRSLARRLAGRVGLREIIHLYTCSCPLCCLNIWGNIPLQARRKCCQLLGIHLLD